MERPLKVLIVEDSEPDTELTVHHLRLAGYDVTHRRVDSEQGLKGALAEESWDLVLCDYKLPGFNGSEAIRIVRDSDLGIPLIVLTGTIGEEQAADVMRQGALDLVLKQNWGRLGPAVERALAEQLLRESEARFRAFIAHSPSSITIKDLQLRYLVFGKDVRASLGNVDPSEGFGSKVIGKTAHDFFPKDVADAFTAHDREVLERMQAIEREHTSIVAGEQRTYCSLKFPIFDDRGHAIAIGGITEDITDRKKAGEAVKEAAARLWVLIDHWPANIYIKDLAGRYLLVNRNFAELAGGSPAEVVGKTDFDFFDGGSAETTLAFDREVIARREPREYEEKLVVLGGAERHFAIYKFPVFDAHGSTIGVGGIHTDITEMKEAEQNLWQAQKVESLGTLAGGIAHDLNNMLLPIMALTDLTIKDMPEGSQSRVRLEKVLEASTRAKDLVARILLFSRKEVPEKRLIRLGDVIREAVELLRSTLPSSMDIDLDIEDENGIILADASQIDAVLMNLGSNAADAMDGRTGKLRVSLSQIGGSASLHRLLPGISPARTYALLRVKDDGIGMDDETISRIFDPFFTTKGVGRGTGLGLSIVHGIVSRHQGAIRVRSHPGKGTTFEIYLPLVSENEECGEEEGQPKVIQAGEGTGSVRWRAFS